MRTLCLTLVLMVTCLLGTGWAQSQAAQSQDRLVDLVEWALAIPLTQAQRSSLTDLIQAWPADRQQQAAQFADELDGHGADQRAGLRTTIRQQLLTGGDDLAKWASQLQAESQQILAAGPPPLTGQMAAAFAEWLLWVYDPQHMPGPAPSVRKSLGDTLVSLYPELGADKRQQLVQLPAYWASLRKSWPGMSPADQDQLLGKWHHSLAPLFDRQEKLKLASAALADVQRALQEKSGSAAVQAAFGRLRQLSSMLRQEKDAGCQAQADHLDIMMATFDPSSAAGDAQGLAQANALSAEIAERGKLPGSDIDSLRPVFMSQGQIFVDYSGTPFRW